MSPLLLRSSLRGLRRHPWQAALSILGVAVGVAVVVGIDLANSSARRAFDLSTEALAGRATDQIVGGPDGLPDSLFVRLETSGVLRGKAAAAPVVEGFGTARPAQAPAPPPGTVDPSATTLRVLGVDPFSEAPFRPYLGAFGGSRDGAGPDARTETGTRAGSAAAGQAGSPATPAGSAGVEIAPLVTRPGAGLLTPETAAALGVRPGERFFLSVSGTEHPIELIGFLEPGDARSRQALRDLLVLDMASAQEVLGRVGRLDRIDLLVPDAGAGPGGGDKSSPGERASRLERIRRLLPPGATLEPATAQSRTFDQMTRAFRLNLTALSLLALVCGMFLIYNTMTFAVVRRRTLFGTLRALGVTRREILAAVLGEAAAVGIVGTALGLAAGVGLGTGLVRLVTRTINDLYFVLSVRELAVDPWSLATGAALGLGATLGAALYPALEATSAPPRAVLTRSALEGRTRRGVPRAALAGTLLGAAGGLLLMLSHGLLAAFAGLFGVILGCALLVPAATVVLMALARRPAEAVLGVLGKMATRGVVAALSRTGVAVAALAIAVSVAVGVGVMISSFRATLVDWLSLTLQADVYVRPPGPDRRPGAAALDPAVLDILRQTPGVERLDLLRRTTVRVEEPHRGEHPDSARPAGALPDQVSLLAFRLGATGRASFRLKEGNPEQAWAAVARGAVLVSEPFSILRGVRAGGTVRLATPQGPRTFPVAGVYYDYATDQGAVLMDLATYRRTWRDRSVSGVSVYASRGMDPEDLASALRRRTAGVQALLVRSNLGLRTLSLQIFDRTFVVTDVLRLLAGLVAFIGVLAALMALELERSRELGVLRANGLTPGQVWQMVTSETGLMGLAAGLLSLPIGLLLAAIMVYVINRRSFGWTLVLEIPPGVLLEALGLALGAALLAGLYPAWTMSRVSPAEALREE